MDFFGAGIPLGRWFRIQVVIHWTFILFALARLSNASDKKTAAIAMGILFATVLVHEFGHALTCKWVGGDALRIILWPLGGLAFVQPPPRPWPALLTTIGGPITHIPMALIWFAVARFALPPTTSRETLNIMEYGVNINLLLLVFNLIPAYPMDGGRILQEVLWLTVGYPRSLQIAGMVGTVAGVGFVVLGLGVTTIAIPWVSYDAILGFYQDPYVLGGGTNMTLIVIGVLAAIESFRIYRQSQEIDSRRKR
jgi:Zn-dependent protease